MIQPIYSVTVCKVADRGLVENHPIYEGYTVKGFVSRLPKVGESFVVFRTERNGLDRFGVFTTSHVRDVEPVSEVELRFTTVNSMYSCRYEKVGEISEE